MSQQTGEIIGVFEIYTDISNILENLNSKQETMFWSMAGILAVFYLALTTSFMGNIKLLRNETRQRQDHLAELHAIHSDLERRVEERTAELDHSKQFLQAIMDNVPDAILTCDSDFVIQSINSSAIRLFDSKESDLIERNLKSLFASDSNVNILKPGISVQKEVILKRIDETEFPADLWIGPFELVDQSSSYIVVVHDITSRTQAQRELEATRQQYFHQEKMAAIGQLAAGILHEVGNPIAAIAGATSELKNLYAGKDLVVDSDSIDDAVSNNIEVIDEQTTRLGKIIREIADFASPKPRDREMLDLNGLLQSTTRVLAYDQRFRSIELDLQLDKNLPAIIGVADQLTQVFMNLLINAMDACSTISGDKERIILKSQLDGDRVHIYVKDNGHGMPKETLGHVLEPFYTTKAVGKGSGLGLSLCETIVLAHGGVLEINTKEGKGTTVHVFLPIDLNGHMPESNEAV
jgi:PAS domain S-box-containing protein